MSIQSHAFGRVTLTDNDATKFRNQITYGKPKKEASNAAKRGRLLAQEFGKEGFLNGSTTVGGRKQEKQLKQNR